MAIGDYQKTTYANGTAPGISAERLNNNENKTAELDQAMGNKVDKVPGKGLSTNDYTTDEKNKLAGIAEGAAVVSVAGKDGVVTLEKGDVGLNNVDNVKQASKAEFDAHAHVFRIPHTYAIPGEIKVPSGDTNYIIPFFVSLASGQTAKLVKARYRINGGTSVTAKLQKNGSDITGFTGISITKTIAQTDPADVPLADNDMLQLVVTAVSGTPKNLTFTLFIEYEQ